MVALGYVALVIIGLLSESIYAWIKRSRRRDDDNPTRDRKRTPCNLVQIELDSYEFEDKIGKDFNPNVAFQGKPPLWSARVDPAQFQSIEWNYRTTHRNFHFCSFALLFGNRVLADPGFLRFWRNFPLTNRKNRTVRRGEIGLSKWILSRDFTHGVTCDLTRLDAELAALDDARLREIADNLIVPEDRRMLEVKHAALQAAPGRQDLIRLILTGVARQGSSYALADFTINECGFPFLKKSPGWLSRESSDITLRLAATLPGDAGAEILAEAQALRRARVPEFDRPA
jgi:hypothetical protein